MEGLCVLNFSAVSFVVSSCESTRLLPCSFIGFVHSTIHFSLLLPTLHCISPEFRHGSHVHVLSIQQTIEWARPRIGCTNAYARHAECAEERYAAYMAVMDDTLNTMEKHLELTQRKAKSCIQAPKLVISHSDGAWIEIAAVVLPRRLELNAVQLHPSKWSRLLSLHHLTGLLKEDECLTLCVILQSRMETESCSGISKVVELLMIGLFEQRELCQIHL